ncbi:50S ribosomal protein L32e [Thermococci archaeon]|nr:MAG: 50S ribosomal protein L32e [Thermococci archaeon]
MRPEEVKRLRKKEKEARKIPKFVRYEYFRFKKLGDKWRRPRGKDSKVRIGMKEKPPRVKVGYRKPRTIRGFHPSGYREVLVSSPSQLSDVNPEAEAVRISSSVGKRKRAEILSKAKELGIRVLNG